MVTLACPSWCVADHRAGRTDPVGLPGPHYGRAAAVPLSIPRTPGLPERIEVGPATCEVELADGVWALELVEVAHHQGTRYSVMALTPGEARILAARLLAAADECDGLRRSDTGPEVG